MTSVLFVCLGNICRSPLAEAALRAEAERLRLDLIVDSAGTGNWHVGHPPDPRAQAVARKYGIDISGYQGRQVTPADFRRFTHVIALDHDNLADLRRIQPADAVAELSLLLDHVPGREGPGDAGKKPRASGAGSRAQEARGLPEVRGRGTPASTSKTPTPASRNMSPGRDAGEGSRSAQLGTLSPWWIRGESAIARGPRRGVDLCENQPVS